MGHWSLRKSTPSSRRGAQGDDRGLHLDMADLLRRPASKIRGRRARSTQVFRVFFADAAIEPCADAAEQHQDERHYALEIIAAVIYPE